MRCGVIILHESQDGAGDGRALNELRPSLCEILCSNPGPKGETGEPPLEQWWTVLHHYAGPGLTSRPTPRAACVAPRVAEPPTLGLLGGEAPRAGRQKKDLLRHKSATPPASGPSRWAKLRIV
ncbi:hypothetical protein NDU88_004355 [Pleurodeles waltl]|uniref:Uncharacterized protein n=1 Tax=Pleurodeles waltl TaxID=8319 RepID=A0AAV7M6W1_PLEWA|nr:hypothetical protein NDU88_004355 [Pleurodeles waltl]